MNRNRWVIVAAIVFGSSWLLLFPYYSEAWGRFVARSSNSPDAAFKVFLILFFSFLFIGTHLLRVQNVKIISVTGMLLSFAVSMGLWIRPEMQSYYVGYGVLGAGVGIYYSALAYLFIFGLAKEVKIRAIAVFLFGSYSLVFAVLNGFHHGRPGVLLGAVALLLPVAAGMTALLNSRDMEDPRKMVRRPFPLKVILLTGVMMFIGYFNSRLIVNIAIMKRPEFGFDENISYLVQLAICVIVFAAGRRLNVFALLYAALTCIGLTYLFALSGAQSGWLFYVFYIVSGSLKDIFIYAFVSGLAAKYGRNLNVLRLSLLFVALGSIVGQMVGSEAALYITGSDIRLYVVSLTILLVSMSVIPWVARYIQGVFAEEGKKPEELPENAGVKANEEAKVNAEEKDFTKGMEQSEGASGERQPESMLFKLDACNRLLPEKNRLTLRELEIAGMLLNRLDYKTISEQLFISENTLKTHIKHVYKEFGVSSRKELIKAIGTMQAGSECASREA